MPTGRAQAPRAHLRRPNICGDFYLIINGNWSAARWTIGAVAKIFNFGHLKHIIEAYFNFLMSVAHRSLPIFLVVHEFKEVRVVLQQQ